MRVTPVSLTQSLIPGVTTLVELVAYCARVSAPGNQDNVATSRRLLDYLIRNKHWSPLEMVDITLEIVTTRDIARQLLRHRSFCFQEFSQRYAEAPAIMVTREARAQDLKNRQNSLPMPPGEIQAEWETMQEMVAATSQRVYQWALTQGIAKEVARSVLPEGMTESRLYMKGSLRSWLHYVEVRTHPSTQLEHRQLAEEIGRVIESISGQQSQVPLRGSQGSPASGPAGSPDQGELRLPSGS